jgi:hypothetical protein
MCDHFRIVKVTGNYLSSAYIPGEQNRFTHVAWQ